MSSWSVRVLSAMNMVKNTGKLILIFLLMSSILSMTGSDFSLVVNLTGKLAKELKRVGMRQMNNLT